MSHTYGEFVSPPGLITAGDLSASQYKAVRFSTTAADTVIVVSATTQAAIGFLQDAPDASGEAATVAVSGVAIAIAGTSTITQGATLSLDASARVITGGAITVGRSLEDAGAVGDQLRVLVALGS